MRRILCVTKCYFSLVGSRHRNKVSIFCLYTLFYATISRKVAENKIQRQNINLEIFKTICDNILHLIKSPDIYLSVKLVNWLVAPKLPQLTREIAVFKSEEWSSCFFFVVFDKSVVRHIQTNFQLEDLTSEGEFYGRFDLALTAFFYRPICTSPKRSPSLYLHYL